MTATPPAALAFERPVDLGDWLAAHHGDGGELWVRIFKAGSGRATVTWADCVVEAIRFGWIDGRKQAGDEASYLQRLTPRRAGSSWSVRNRTLAERLIADGRMMPAGLAQVAAARADGRWQAAYDGQRAMAIPQDFLEALAAVPAAAATFRTLNRTALYPIYHQLQTAKRPETRARRMARMIDRLARGERP